MFYDLTKIWGFDAIPSRQLSSYFELNWIAWVKLRDKNGDSENIFEKEVAFTLPNTIAAPSLTNSSLSHSYQQNQTEIIYYPLFEGYSRQ